jgi:hypothetical protein
MIIIIRDRMIIWEVTEYLYGLDVVGSFMGVNLSPKH